MPFAWPWGRSGPRPVGRSPAGSNSRVTASRWPVPLRFDRSASEGLHPLLRVFPGFSELPAFALYPGARAQNRAVVEGTAIQVTAGPGFMYVAPKETPPEVRAAGYEMYTSTRDAIAVAGEYLRTGAELDIYLDILHEFLHILQRRSGRELWPAGIAYVDRTTELEAYAFSVAEARRLGVPDPYLRRYLEVSWVSPSDHLRLIERLGLAPG